MTLHLNGEARAFDPAPAHLGELLELLGLGGKPVVVELDREPVFPAAYAATALHEGARLEIVVIAAGG